MKPLSLRVVASAALALGLLIPASSAFAQNIVLTRNAVVVNAGTSAMVTASGLGSGQMVISSNSSSGVASATQNAGDVTITGTSAGTTTIVLCSSDTTIACASVYVTVEPAGNGQLSFSRENLYVAGGSITQVTLSGGGSGATYVVSNSTNSSAAYTSISANTLSVTAGSISGVTWLTICTSDGKICNTLSVNGSGGGSPIAAPSPSPSDSPAPTVTSDAGGPQLNPSSITVAVGQSGTVAVNGAGSYYVLSNTNPNAAVVGVNGNNLSVYGQSSGTASTLICQAGGLCTALSITIGTVALPSPTPTVAPIAYSTPVPGPVSSGYIFTSALKLGSQGDEVTALQNALAAQGYFSGTASGYFGPQTQKAVMAFQSANGLSPLGSVGPGTRLALNQSAGGSGIPTVAGASTQAPTAPSVPTSAIATMTLGQLQAQVLALQTQITQILIRISQLSGQ